MMLLFNQNIQKILIFIKFLKQKQMIQVSCLQIVDNKMQIINKKYKFYKLIINNMDLLTKKKYLMKKFTQSTFSNEQIIFFKKLNQHQIIQLLKQNPILRNNETFFHSIQIKQLQKIIVKVFDRNCNEPLKIDILNLLVTLMKQKTVILEVCFGNQQFNHSCIFCMMHSTQVDFSSLVVLQDIFLPFVRKMPQKIMEMFCNDIELEQLVFSRIYEKPIFIIVYTMIFCMSRKFSQMYKLKIKHMVNQLLQTPFRYMKQLQKKNQLIPLVKIKSMDIENMNENRKKNSNLGMISSFRHLSSFGKNNRITHKFNLLNPNNCVEFEKEKDKQKQKQKQKRSEVLTKNPSELFQQKSQQDVEEQFSEQQNSIEKQISQNSQDQFLNSQGDIQYELNDELDYCDLTENIQRLAHDLAINFDTIYLRNLSILLSKFNESYLKRLLESLQRYCERQEYQYQGYCLGIIDLLKTIIELYEKVRKLQIKSTENEKKKIKQRLNSLIKFMAQRISWMREYILEDNGRFIYYSSGERVKRVGMIKYRLIELITKLMQLHLKWLNQNQSRQNIIFDFKYSTLIPIIQKYLISVKWNNILHCMLIKLVEIILKLDYEGFKQTYLNVSNPKNGLFGLLVENFRNKKFIYLNNMKFSNYGNVSFVHQISEIIIENVKKNDDLSKLTEKFRFFDEFIQKDLIDYYKQQTQSQYMDNNYIQPDKHIINCILQPQNVKMLSEPLQKIQTYISQLQGSKRWSQSIMLEDSNEKSKQESKKVEEEQNKQQNRILHGKKCG